MDTILLWVLLVTAAAGVGGTMLGGIVSACFRRESSRGVSLLLSFAAGVMLSVVCFDLVLSAVQSQTFSRERSLLLTVLGIGVGFALVAALNYAIDKSTNREVKHIDASHPKTADDLDELIHADHLRAHEDSGTDNGQLCLAGVIMAAAIGLHNLPEGMVIGAAYVDSAASALWTSSGLVLAVIIGLHNIPEGMAIAVPLIAGGMRRSRAVLTTAVCGLPTVLGALIGYLLGSVGETWHILSLAFASGAMLYVIFGELLPEAILMWRSKLPALAVLIGMLCGIVLIFA
ncbi:MAG: ZIP family metal transporter [Oscillospiraceae bacterium]|nr:ZIP family metal transporter [Oscillospiraceae bacterium]